MVVVVGVVVTVAEDVVSRGELVVVEEATVSPGDTVGEDPAPPPSQATRSMRAAIEDQRATSGCYRRCQDRGSVPDPDNYERANYMNTLVTYSSDWRRGHGLAAP